MSHTLQIGAANRAIIERSITSLKPYPRNARTHSRKQIRQIAKSIERFGFVNPVLVCDADEIIAGHGRVEAAKHLGLTTVPTLALSHLSDSERRAYILADNKLALNAGWDQELLALELQGLIDLNFDVEATGFSLAEIDFTLDQAKEAKVDGRDLPENEVPPLADVAVSRMGDVWRLGKPPRWARFEKGRSGNPKGRPRKYKKQDFAPSVLPESQADRALRRELDRKIQITDAKGTKLETMADAIVRQQVAQAAKGNIPAIRDVRQAQRELEIAEAERARQAAIAAAEAEKAAAIEQANTFQFISELKREQAIAWEEAARQGKAEPDNPWPHPDDVHISHVNKTFAIRGPLSAEHMPDFEFYRAMRDKHFVEMIVWMRRRGKAAKAKASFYGGLMGVYDALLPNRRALGPSGFEYMASFYLLMPLGFLVEDLGRAERMVRVIMPASHAGPIRRSSSYAEVNASMRPLLKQMGYVSYAQFEKAYEENGGNPPWPKRKVA